MSPSSRPAVEGRDGSTRIFLLDFAKSSSFSTQFDYFSSQFEPEVAIGAIILWFFNKASELGLAIEECTTAHIAGLCIWPATASSSSKFPSSEHIVYGTIDRIAPFCAATSHIFVASITVFSTISTTWRSLFFRIL